jgi:hypothetical protein
VSEGYVCPICGFTGLDEPPYDSDHNGSYEICPCCGFEFGVTDGDEHFTIDEWRERWLLAEMPWWSHSRLPEIDWDPATQLATLLGGAD